MPPILSIAAAAPADSIACLVYLSGSTPCTRSHAQGKRRSSVCGAGGGLGGEGRGDTCCSISRRAMTRESISRVFRAAEIMVLKHTTSGLAMLSG
jgi:hypothetical protein